MYTCKFVHCSGKVLRQRRERDDAFFGVICNLMECTHAAFLSIVWVGSKNHKDGGKHAETEPCNTDRISSGKRMLFLL